MAKKRFVRTTHEWKGKKILIGTLIFFVGLLRYLEIDWSIILMIVGALVVLKGALIK